MTRKQTTLGVLMRQSPDWIRKSAANPNKYMTAICVKLHYIALRRMGEL